MDNNFNHDYEDNLYNDGYSYSKNMSLVPIIDEHNNDNKKKPFYKTPMFLTLILSIIVSSAAGFAGGMFANNFNSSTGIAPLQITTSSATETAVKDSSSNITNVSQVAAAAGNSVVEITTETVTTGSFMQQYISEGAGSGVIISSDGYIITNNHVISNASKITVTLKDSKAYQAKLIGTDTELDVALLKIEATGLNPAIFGDSSKLQVGELAVAIGNPLGQLGGTVTDGIISALNRDITISGETMNLLQTSAAINPGNSGGGLFNASGQLIGLVVAKSSGSDVEGLGFAIPINDVKEVVEQLSKYGYVKGRIDMQMSLLDIESEQAAMMYRVLRTGVYVSKVTQGSNAEKAGFQVGDCIISVDSKSVKTSSDIDSILDNRSVGDTISVTVVRNNQQINLNWTLAEYNPTISNNSNQITYFNNNSEMTNNLIENFINNFRLF